MPSHCATEGSVLAFRKEEDERGFDWHLVTVLKIEDWQKMHVTVDYSDVETHKLLNLKN